MIKENYEREKMKFKKIILLLEVVVIILTIMLLTGVGYAKEINALQVSENKELQIEKEEFKVQFTGKPRYTGNGIAQLEITDNKVATMKISGLKTVGDYVTTIWEIENLSRDLYVDIDTTITNTNKEYFNVTSKVLDPTLKPKNGKTKIEITVELIKIPIEKDQEADICINIIGKPKYN